MSPKNSSIEIIKPSQRFHGKTTVPGDKSISHRGLIFGALAKGRTEVVDILESGDVQSTARCLRDLGVTISQSGRSTFVEGVGRFGFQAAKTTLDCGNSGTTMRLMMGVLAGQKFTSELTGDVSLVKRPMKRVADPLTQMGGRFELRDGNFAPLKVLGSALAGIDYDLKVSSAQIKTAIILAALLAGGTTRIRGLIQSRDHTERMLGLFGVKIKTAADLIEIDGGQDFQPARVQVPGDPSTAAFWMAAASMISGGDIEIDNLSLNPTRTGFMRALERMGARVEVTTTLAGHEPVGRVRVRSAELKAIAISEAEVPSLIDEIPMLAVLATQASGKTVVEGAEELRVKESDRIEAVATNLRAMGAKIDVKPDGFIIEGPQKLHGAEIQTFHDHRIAMAFSVAGLVASGETRVLDADSAGISYPEFYSTLRQLTSGPA